MRIPPNESNIDNILPFLAESLKAIARHEVIKCALFVEAKLFPLAANCRPLSLRQEVRRFQTTHTESAFGDSQDILSVSSSDGESDDRDDGEGSSQGSGSEADEENIEGDE